MSTILLYPAFGGVDPILNNTYKDGNGTIQYIVRTPATLTGLGRITSVFKSKDSSTKGHTGPSATNSHSQVEYVDDAPPAPDGRTSINLDEAPVVAEEQKNPGEKETVVEVEEEGMMLVGKIGWNLFKSSTIVFKDEPELEADHYFRKESWGWWGRHRAFTAHGKEYKWVLGFYSPQLILNDGSSTVVAQFHRRKFILWNTPPGYLEIFPAGVDIIDTILVTFIYIEKLRKDKERSVSKPNRAF